MIEIRLAPDLLAELRRRESHYDEQAYLFVLGGIEYLQHRLPVRRHVSGSELAWACRDWALEQYGLLARQVLEFWGIRRTDDLGRIVFALVEVGLLMTQPTDRLEDFHQVYDFQAEFGSGYAWQGVGDLADFALDERGPEVQG
ncbi:MAG: Minf_1886 family protein [Gemmatimonadales bacterium]